eukprot:scaffold208098_cov18-Tisochrysis_lutea.AAC.2
MSIAAAAVWVVAAKADQRSALVQSEASPLCRACAAGRCGGSGWFGIDWPHRARAPVPHTTRAFFYSSQLPECTQPFLLDGPASPTVPMQFVKLAMASV